jgi:hypothetical protein
MAVEAIVLFFSRRGQILLLQGCHQREFDCHYRRNSLSMGRGAIIIIYNNITITITIIIPSEIDVIPSKFV